MKMEKAISQRQQTYDSNVNADMRLFSYQTFKNEARKDCHISDLFHALTATLFGLSHGRRTH